LLAAYSEGSHTVTTSHIKSAAQDSEFKKAANNKQIFMRVGGLLLLAGALVAGFYMGKQDLVVQQQTSTMPLQPEISGEPGQSVTEVDEQAEEGKPVSGLLAERVEKTKRWLSAAAADHYSIQLFMARTSDADKVESFLNDVPETLDLTEVYIYETVINGRAWYSLLYSDFATQDDAIDTLDKLPSSLKASDPYLRRVSALKKDSANNE
jgi:septal ring-binding cell division protein DamX